MTWPTHDYNWKEAEEQFRLARASEPFPPDAHDGAALFYLLPLGRFEEAIQEQVSPVTVVRDWSAAWLYRELTSGTNDASRKVETNR